VRYLDVAVVDAADGSSPAIDRVADGSMTNGRAVDRARWRARRKSSRASRRRRARMRTGG